MSYDTMTSSEQRIVELEAEVEFLRSEVARLSRTSSFTPVRGPVPVPSIKSVFNVASRTRSPPPRRELPSIHEAAVAPLTSPLERLKIREEP